MLYGVITHYYYDVLLPVEIIRDESSGCYWLGTFNKRTSERIRESKETFLDREKAAEALAKLAFTYTHGFGPVKQPNYSKPGPWLTPHEGERDWMEEYLNLTETD
jgi:hypothetical protein